MIRCAAEPCEASFGSRNSPSRYLKLNTRLASYETKLCDGDRAPGSPKQDSGIRVFCPDRRELRAPNGVQLVMDAYAWPLAVKVTVVLSVASYVLAAKQEPPLPDPPPLRIGIRTRRLAPAYYSRLWSSHRDGYSRSAVPVSKVAIGERSSGRFSVLWPDTARAEIRGA